jgi:hypothetical protein
LVEAVVKAYKSEVVDVEAERKRAVFSDLEKAVADIDEELRQKKQERRNLAPPSSPGTGKGESPKPLSVDLEMLDLEIKILEQELREVHFECRRARIELRAPPRISIYERVEEPAEPD